MKMPIEILPYSPLFKEAVIQLILSIQQKEFGIPITRADQPDLENICAFYQQGKGNFWIAKRGNMVIGTTALVDLQNGEGALRKVFVDASYRGKPWCVAKSLLDTMLAWAKTQQMQTVFLGTTSVFLAAHRFYEKNGFDEIKSEELPETFPRMALDSKFYRKTV
jgi:N-acetylglutamate synthase-like GNAT family acetyltransferase